MSRPLYVVARWVTTDTDLLRVPQLLYDSMRWPCVRAAIVV